MPRESVGVEPIRDRYRPEEFDKERYSRDNLAFWTPLLVNAARLQPGQRLLDIGCATGGLTAALAARVVGFVVGLDASATLLGFAKHKRGDAAVWVHGAAERLPFAPAAFDRLVASLVVHQLDNRHLAFQEARRVLGAGGVLLIRTVAPEAAAEYSPARFFPSVRAAQQARMPPIQSLIEELQAAGFEGIGTDTVIRTKRLVLEEVEASLQRDVEDRYPWLQESEVEAGVAAMRQEAGEKEPWVEERRVTFIVATTGR